MSRRKVSTLLDDKLYRGAKVEAARQNKQISEIIAEALTAYLRERRSLVGPIGAVASSWAALKADADLVHKVLADEDDLFET